MTTALLRSYLLVLVQLTLAGYILVTGPLLVAGAWDLALEAAGLILGGWAILTMAPGRFNIIPEVAQRARMVTEGPYRWIRHPMYAALLLITLSLIIHRFSSWRLLSWVLLLLVLRYKWSLEEKLLAERFPDYAPYKKKTKRLVPFMY
jgi:protein-S-isoprenylcysteine O-methyltransferase Ste14